MAERIPLLLLFLVISLATTAFSFQVNQQKAFISPTTSSSSPKIRQQQEQRRQQRHHVVLYAMDDDESNNKEKEDRRNRIAKVAFVSGSAQSGYGKTSPMPNPSWKTIGSQLALRLPNFAGTTLVDGEEANIISTMCFQAESIQSSDLKNVDVVVALGVGETEQEEQQFLKALDDASSSNEEVRVMIADPTCGTQTLERCFAGSYQRSESLNDIVATTTPWSTVASHKRLLDKVDVLLARKSSEDYLFAVLFCIHSLVTDIDVVKSDINPSWEKGVVQNVKEFQKMTDCCGPQIYNALTDPQTKNAIDLLNAVDLRDQVGSYRVIVSNETPQLEEFTLCILQQNNCFNCDAPILDRPKVPLLKEWRGKPLDDDGAKQILIGHLNHPSSAFHNSQQKPWSWKIVVGANPAYDAFPMQHQIFYPSDKTPNSIWYDPVFCVEPLEGGLIWCKRHYRCQQRKHFSQDKTGLGAWTFTTLDNGMESKEFWTTVDADDDLSWCVLHYSGAARRAGQSYVGALLCTPDGKWPEKCREGEGLERIRKAFQSCDLELWELFGGSTDETYMWSNKFTNWAEKNPPPLEPIGDISINAWRKQERAKALKES